MEKNYILKDGTLYHHGVPGQKWGVRRYQNEDGTLTAEGREHYGLVGSKERNSVRAAKKKSIEAYNAYRKNKSAENKEAFKKARHEYNSKHLSYLNSDEYKFQDKNAEKNFVKDLTKEYRNNMNLGEKIVADIVTLDFVTKNYSKVMALSEGNISKGKELLKMSLIPYYSSTKAAMLEMDVKEKL